MKFEDVSPTPIIDAIKKIQNSEIIGLDSEVDAALEFILHYAENQRLTLQKHFTLYEEILQKIHDLTLENEAEKKKRNELWESLEKALDSQFREMSSMDQQLYLMKVQDAYFNSWDILDEKSRIMLATAFSIHDAIRNTPNRDMSPVIIECCRAFENEFKQKLYDRFIPSIDPYKSPDAIDPYTCVVKAATSLKHRGFYFLSLADMIKCVKELRNTYKKCSLSDALSIYLSQNQWDKNKLTDPSFTNESLIYTNKYRNKSAHPNIMYEDDVVNCIKLTKRLVQHFVSCFPTANSVTS